MTTYLQSTYETPFAPLVPPSHPAYALNDEFSASRPASPTAGYVQLASKWLTWDPGTHISLAAIDPARQMALLRGSSIKEWYGKVQPLPLPTVNGQTVQIALYMRSMLGFQAPLIDYFEVLCGLVIGRDLIGAAATSDLISIHQLHQRASGVHQMSVQASTFATYAGLNSPLGASLQAAALLRARISQLRNAGPTYDITIALDASPDPLGGAGWIPVGSVTLAAQANPYRHAGFAARGEALVTDLGVYTDFFRVGVQTLTDLSATTGGVQQFGAV